MTENRMAYVTLVTNDSYTIGALVLGHSLRQVGTTKELVALVSDGVSQHMQNMLRQLYDLVQPIQEINSSLNDQAMLDLAKRPELGITLSKIHCWKLIQFSKCVFLDADTMVIKNCDELFERDELSAVPDVGWPDCFNSGVFVFTPSDQTFFNLIQCVVNNGSHDGGDQGLLNDYFSDWRTKDVSRILSFIYNMSLVIVYSYPPAYKKFAKDVKIVHFLGSTKPWMYRYNKANGNVYEPHSNLVLLHSQEHLQTWWKIFMEKVGPAMEACAETSLLAAEYMKLHVIDFIPEVSGLDGNEATSYEGFDRRRAWESGQIDYTGKDSFANIQRKLDDAISR